MRVTGGIQAQVVHDGRRAPNGDGATGEGEIIGDEMSATPRKILAAHGPPSSASRLADRATPLGQTSLGARDAPVGKLGVECSNLAQRLDREGAPGPVSTGSSELWITDYPRSAQVATVWMKPGRRAVAPPVSLWALAAMPSSGPNLLRKPYETRSYSHVESLSSLNLPFVFAQ